MWWWCVKSNCVEIFMWVYVFLCASGLPQENSQRAFIRFSSSAQNRRGEDGGRGSGLQCSLSASGDLHLSDQLWTIQSVHWQTDTQEVNFFFFLTNCSCCQLSYSLSTKLSSFCPCEHNITSCMKMQKWQWRGFFFFLNDFSKRHLRSLHTENAEISSLNSHLEKLSLELSSAEPNMTGPISVFWEERGGSCSQGLVEIKTGSHCKVVNNGGPMAAWMLQWGQFVQTWTTFPH